MSVSNQAKRRGTILNEIMIYQREQLPKIMRAVPLADLRALASVSPPAADLAAAIGRPGISLIAECKKASPSKGLLLPDYSAVQLAGDYVRAGAAAISVLTDGRHFQGSLADLRDVKELVSSPGKLLPARDPRRATGIPVLRKDFIFHPYQLYEARAAGADAVLLIAAVLEGGEFARLLELTRELGMQALIEVHTADELQRVLAHQPRIIGVNNRNLQTFEVDFKNTARLRQLVPPGILLVAESGIRSKEDIARLREIHIDAVLVGETLVKSPDPQKMARTLVEAGQG
jgi:indole-3-glycerol phosphate synthase